MCNIWMRTPAEKWNDAFPIGNGKIGAMLYGRPDTEYIDLNEDTFWAGYPHNKTEGVKSGFIEDIRKSMLSGDMLTAEKLAHKYMQGEEVDGYQPLGRLEIEYQGPPGEIYNERRLDIINGIHTSTFRKGGRNYRTVAFASIKYNVIAVRITCDRPAYFRIKLDGHHLKERDEGKMMLVVRGQAPEVSNSLAYHYSDRVLHRQGNRGVRYEASVTAHCNGSSAKECGELRFMDVTELTLYISAVTSYDGMEKLPCSDFEGKACKMVSDALSVGYDTILSEHIKWFSGHMKRVTLKLGKNEEISIPTDERLKRINDGSDDPEFSELYFQFGRYLLLSSSACGMPANLQGIWNNDEKAPWNSNYTININLPMNYWVAETGNLSFCHMPLFKFLKQSVNIGKKAAKAYFGCNGFFLSHNSDLWGSANPVKGRTFCTVWTTGAAWLCRHIWEHYMFTQDKEFLSEYLSVITESARFCCDYLSNDVNGFLTYSPSSSPENAYFRNGEEIGVTNGSTMELTIVQELFEIYISAAKELEVEYDNKIENAMKHLRPVSVGSDGRLLEWAEEEFEKDRGHRHMSHLYGIFPGSILERNKEHIKAAKKSLDYRMENGSGYTGWSAAWATCLYSRFGDGNKAYDCLKKLWKSSTLPNLFDTCNNVFQIDGNLGAPAAIIEMLVQSHRNRIELLPALPEAWSCGYVKGICLRGGGEIEMSWNNGELEKYKIYGQCKYPVYYRDRLIENGTDISKK